MGGAEPGHPDPTPAARSALPRGPRRAPHRRRAGPPLANFVAGSCGRTRGPAERADTGHRGRTPGTAARPPEPTELLSAAATPP